MRLAIDARKIDDYGIGTYIRGLVDALAVARPTWKLCLIGDPAATPWQAPEAADWITERARGYGIAELRRIARAAARARADVFHAPHYVFPLRLHCPGVVTIHDCIHLRFPEYLPRPLGVLPRALSAAYARAMMRHACRAATQVLTVSSASRHDLVERLGVRPEQVGVIPNGCDAFWSEPGDAEDNAAIDDSLGSTGRFVLWVGNAKPHKNLPRLLAAFEMLRRREPDVTLLLVGSSPRDGVSGTATRALGRVSDRILRRLYQRAEVLAIPSLYEGFGLPAAEAMAAGTPVVYGNAGGLVEVVGDAGTAVDPTDTEAIAAALGSFLESPKRAAEVGARGRVRAGGMTWARCAEATAAVYERIATPA